MPDESTPQDGEEEHSADVLRAICRSVRDKGCSQYLRPYIAKSRLIAQTIHPFINLVRAFYAGVPDAARMDEDDKEHEDEEEQEDGNDDEYTEEEAYVFRRIMKLQRGFPAVVKACSIDARAFVGLIGLISKASGQARGDDTSSLKTSILDLIYEDPKAGSKFQSLYDIDRLLGTDPKDIRGFLHLDTADLLCPLSMKEEFDEDPVAFTTMVIDGKIVITNDDFPSFMYESGTEYDSEDEMTGLFRGFILIRVFRHIYTGPSTALHANRNPNKTRAKKFGIKKVTGRMIAYTAAQTYISLSSSKKWGTFVDNFNVDEFYENIVDMFEQSADSPFIKETLEWWNTQIPGLRAIKKKIKGPTRAQRSRKGLTPAERFKAQLDKKEHELEEQHQFEEKQRQLEEQHRLQHQLEEQRKIEQQQQSSSPTPKPRKLTPRQSPDAENDAESPSSRRFRYRLTEPDNEQNLWSVNEDEFEWDEDAEEGQGKGSDNDEDEDDELAEQHRRAARQVEIMKTNAHTHKDDRRAHGSHDVQPDQDAFKRRDKENEHKKANIQKKSDQEVQDDRRKEKHAEVPPKPSNKPSKPVEHKQLGDAERKKVPSKAAPDPEPSSTKDSRRTRSTAKRVLADLSESELTQMESPPPKKVRATGGKRRRV